MMGELISLPPRWEGQPLTYEQLSNHLGVSRRFIQARVAEGMPAYWDWSGKRRLFRLTDVEQWLRENRERSA